MFKDVQYAFRLLLKSPAFTFLTTAVMAVGLGLSIYLLTFIHTLLYKPLPFEDSDRLVQFSSSLDEVRILDGLNAHDFQEIRENLDGVAEFGAYRNTNVSVSGTDGARRYLSIQAEESIFKLTRTQPLLGRDFNSDDNKPGAADVVVIGHKLWQTQFLGSPDVIGKIIRVNSRPSEIIGVMPEGYKFPHSVEVWIPLREHAVNRARGEAGDVYGLGILEEGVSKADINRELSVIMKRIEEKYPKTNNGVGAYAETIPLTNLGNGQPVVKAMQIAAILILILACINVGNLLFSRAIERGKETAIRVALGAPRYRLIVQMLWESTIICCIGGVIGLLFLAWGLELTEVAVSKFFEHGPSFWWVFSVDGYVFGLFGSFLLATIFLTGFLPALKHSNEDFNSVLRDGTRGSLSKKTGRMNKFLVISEVFVSLVVLSVAGTFIVSAYKSSRIDIGANTDNTLTARFHIPAASYSYLDDSTQLLNTIESRFKETSEFSGVVIASALPGEFTYKRMDSVEVEGREYADNKGYTRVNAISINPGALNKLGIELRAGRFFEASDNQQGESSAIVTESFVKTNFPSGNPIGRRILFNSIELKEQRWLTIVGVVEHIIHGDPNEESGQAPTVYQPYAQVYSNEMRIALPLRVNVVAASSVLRNIFSSIDPDLAPYKIETYKESIDRNTYPNRFMSAVFLLFGLAATALAGSGIYGVMSNTITQRTQEIGVKRALGAEDSRITKEILISAILQLMWGTLPGLVCGAGLGYAMGKIIGVSTYELVYIELGLGALFACVLLFSTYLPTRKALAMEPSDALRYQ